jgi:uncharacterized protein (DUF1778 family)
MESAMATETTVRLSLRLAPEIHARLKIAADLTGQTLSQFVVSAGREAAEKVVAEEHIIRLTEEDRRDLLRAIADPPRPNAALRRAFRRHRALLRNAR